MKTMDICTEEHFNIGVHRDYAIKTKLTDGSSVCLQLDYEVTLESNENIKKTLDILVYTNVLAK